MYPERRTAWIIRAYRLDGTIEAARLTDAMSRLHQRHWYLSCRIDSSGKVHPQDVAIPVEVELTDDDPWEEAQRYCQTRMVPFRLERGELFRLYVVQGKSESVMVFAIHHVLADQHSVDVLTNELSVLYEGNEEELTAPPDVIRAYEQQKHALEENRSELQDFWRNRLEQLPSAVALPMARALNDRTDRKGKLIRCKANSTLAKQCRAAAADAGVSPYQWFLAAWIVLLGHYHNRDDVHLGTVFSTRSDMRLKDAVGCFLNVLIVRTNLKITATFADVLEETRSVLGSAIAHGGLPLDEIARLTPVSARGGQLFSTLFTLVATEHQPQLFERNVLQAEEPDYGGTAFDLSFFVFTSGDDLTFAIEFDTAVYDEKTLAGVFDHYQALVASFAENKEVDWRSSMLVSAAELERLDSDWRRITATPLPNERLHDAFYKCAAAQPDSTALRWDTAGSIQEMSYGELALRANAIAAFIDSLCSDDDTMVAIIGAWHPDSVAALIGILRSGRTYLPVDATYPEARIKQILHDAGRPLVLLQQGAPAPASFADRCHSIADVTGSGTAPDIRLVKNEVAYVIFTSGSSGAPKGVRVSHGAAVYSTRERNRVYADWPPGTFLLLSSFAFDSAVAGLWWSLSNGGSLRLVEKQTARAADLIAELIGREQITHTLCLPSQWNDICRISKGPLDSMRHVVVAGEACSANTVKQHFERAPGAALYNEYGPTETTVWSTFHRLEANAKDPVPIGQPLASTQALVIDTYGNPVPRGLAGELLLAGHGIADGYVGDRSGGFVSHPRDPEGRAYRTGDRVRVDADSLFYYIGRMDEQVKYRGYRIGIESIEQTMSTAEVAVIPWNGISLEDLLDDLPKDSAHALLDKYLPDTKTVERPRESLLQQDPHFRLELSLENDFIATPRPAQRAWLLRKAMQEWAKDLKALDRLAPAFVAGRERKTETDFKNRALTELSDEAIMEDWQIPIMRAMAAIVGRSGGAVLEIGFGRGISAEFIQQHDIDSHTIIESESAVVERYFRPWRETHANADIQLHIGKWQKCDLSAQSYDAILFHAYPLDEAEFFEHIVSSVTYAEHAIPAMARLLRPGGRFTYLSNEIDSLSRTHQRLLFDHFRQIRSEIIDVDIPEDTFDAWWAPKMVVVEAVR